MWISTLRLEASAGELRATGGLKRGSQAREHRIEKEHARTSKEEEEEQRQEEEEEEELKQESEQEHEEEEERRGGGGGRGRGGGRGGGNEQETVGTIRNAPTTGSSHKPHAVIAGRCPQRWPPRPAIKKFMLPG